MKVAFVLGTSTGGTARHVRMLAAGGAAQAVPVEVFGPAQTDRDFGFSTVPGVGFTAVDIADRPRVRRDLAAIRRLRRLLGAWRPDVVHAHGLRAGALTAIAVAFVRPGTYDARPALIVTVHNAPAAGGVTGAVYRALGLIVGGGAPGRFPACAGLSGARRPAPCWAPPRARKDGGGPPGPRRVGPAPVPAL